MKRNLVVAVAGVAIIGIAIVMTLRSSKAVSARKADDQVISLSAKKFAFSPGTITVKKGVPVVLEMTSEDRVHGFKLPEFKVRSDIKPGAVTRVSFTPDKTGEFSFSCDVFCGDGHEQMDGTLIVTE